MGFIDDYQSVFGIINFVIAECKALICGDIDELAVFLPSSLRELVWADDQPPARVLVEVVHSRECLSKTGTQNDERFVVFLEVEFHFFVKHHVVILHDNSASHGFVVS